MCDALDTYFVFLRTRVLCGMISVDRERQLVDQAKKWIETAASHSLALAEYLRHFQFWRPVGDDDDPFTQAEA
jgi:hypothetical protein